jgi:hypothetical protein
VGIVLRNRFSSTPRLHCEGASNIDITLYLHQLVNTSCSTTLVSQWWMALYTRVPKFITRKEQLFLQDAFTLLPEAM